jgi:hypothetical protein
MGNHQSAQGKARSPRLKLVSTDKFVKQGGQWKGDRFANHSGLGKIVERGYFNLS